VARAPLWQAQGKLSLAKRERRLRYPFSFRVSVSLRDDGYRDPYSRVPRIKQKIPAFDEVDIAVVGVCPSSRPGLPDFEPVAAVREVRVACHHGHVADSKVVLASKVRVKVFIGDVPQFGASFFMCNVPFLGAPLFMSYVPLFGTPLLMRFVPLFLAGFVPFFLAYFFSFPVPVLFLSRGGNSASQQQ
jgi:hypothetical protein